MSDPTPLLTREQRRRLLDALNTLPLFEQEEGRNLLLSDLPPSLIQQVPRSDTKIIDLEAIVRTVEAWGTLDDSTPALAILIENARFYGQGGNAGRSLDELSTELGPLFAPKPVTPAAETKSASDPVAPAVVAAAAAPPVADVAKAEAPAPPVGAATAAPDVAAVTVAPALGPAPAADGTAPASAPSTPDALAAALTAAHAGQRWVEVLTLARQLGGNLPLALVGPVAQAWHNLPLTALAFAGHAKKIRAVAITSDSRYGVTASEDNTLILWDLATGQATRTFRGEDRALLAVAVTPDGQRILSGSEGGTLTIWDGATGSVVSTIRVNSLVEVRALAVLPGGTQVVSGGQEGKLKLWDLASGRLVREMDAGGFASIVTALAALPGGTQVVASSVWAVALWDVTTGQRVQTLAGNDDLGNQDVIPVAVAADGRRVLAALADNSIGVWTLPTPTPALRLTGHSKAVNAVAFTPDGHYAVSGADDDTIRLWNLTLGQQVFQFAAGAGGVKVLALSPDGRTLLYAGTDKLLHVLPFPPGVLA
jgi:hypothetical protein